MSHENGLPDGCCSTVQSVTCTLFDTRCCSVETKTSPCVPDRSVLRMGRLFDDIRVYAVETRDVQAIGTVGEGLYRCPPVLKRIFVSVGVVLRLTGDIRGKFLRFLVDFYAE